MSASKIVILVSYAIMAFLAVTQPESPYGIWSLRILVILAIAHTVEMFVFYKACQRAGGSLAGHLFNVFLFGVFHMQGLKKTGEIA
jgi:uncharacterized protein YhhL (DUF1145 family)